MEKIDSFIKEVDGKSITIVRIDNRIGWFFDKFYANPLTPNRYGNYIRLSRKLNRNMSRENEKTIIDLLIENFKDTLKEIEKNEAN